MTLFLPVPALKKPPTIPKSKKLFYAEYIQSSEWQAKRKERIKLDGGKCRGFHLLPKRTGLQVHHRSYSRLGDESVRFDLVTLCKSCHRKAHK